jgi:uncharacterized protein YjiS (DUF1127 family)
MSCTQTALRRRHPHRHGLCSAGAEARLRGKALRLIARTAARWIARSGQRHDLANLDHHLLEDIGVTSQDAAREAAKPFWRD